MTDTEFRRLLYLAARSLGWFIPQTEKEVADSEKLLELGPFESLASDPFDALDRDPVPKVTRVASTRAARVLRQFVAHELYAALRCPACPPDACSDPSDIRVSEEHAVLIFKGLSDAGRRWLADHVIEPRQLDQTYVVATRFALPIVRRAQDDGFKLEVRMSTRRRRHS